ncbi:hypothetical protein FC96_GL000901 [Secundilactobacillus kimchicus JCM 15530]|uniref:SCP domain-containing protein n=1 Tax=Secundilactobacillus kimchicus JCM 15530 TaxID=1302272 RepID=A0A0R1HU75_9LACO|nr:CAP domain-containing protein [Secundilactobacillus kimchicus]KRK46842.1 hypothetical protein FC96_GL000901 [Secundilactobacillus kimchicus JCM 15530]
MKKKMNLAIVALTIGVLSSFGSVSASAKAKVNYYRNVKDANYVVLHKKTPAYTTATLKYRRGTLKFWQDVRVTHIANVTKANGHRAFYYRIRTKSGKTGWVWRGWLGKVISTPTATTREGKMGSNSSTTQKTVKHFSNAEYRQAFLTGLNAERTKRGIAPLTEDSQLDQLADVRAPELIDNFSHYDASDNVLFEKHAQELGITTAVAENIAYMGDSDGGKAGSDEIVGGNSAAYYAKSNLHEFIYNDADSNWGHRDALLNPQYTIIGISSAYVVGQDGDAKQYGVNNLG